jgi:hypothetical protein
MERSRFICQIRTGTSICGEVAYTIEGGKSHLSGKRHGIDREIVERDFHELLIKLPRNDNASVPDVAGKDIEMPFLHRG